jgi:Xaa-Pro aminopeptidase
MADPFSAAKAGAKIPGTGTGPIPFDQDRLHLAMDNAHLDAVLVTSKVNVRYLTGGYNCIFFETMNELGIGQYGPTILYRKTHPEHTLFLGSYFDKEQLPNDPIWIPNADISSWVHYSTIPLIIDWIKKEKLENATIGLEYPFLAADIYMALQSELPNVKWVDAVKPLEYVRAIKRPDELAILRSASEKVVEAMLYGFRETKPGMSSRDIEQMVAHEERRLGLTFDYCLVGVGKDANRTPRDNIKFETGMIMDFDSGGNIKGYIGDVCRMGSSGEPEPLQKQLLEEINHVQMASRAPIKPGARGGEIVDAGKKAIAECEHGSWMGYIAHGMGLVSHEAPRLVTKPIPYPNEWAEQPLEAGMVVSIETTIAKPESGYVKLEDTVSVTETGWEGFGDGGRGWNPIGS